MLEGNKKLIVVIYFLLFLVNLLISKEKYRTIFNPAFIYTIIWSFSGVLAYYNLNNYVDVSVQVHLYAIISIIVFTIISLLTHRSVIVDEKIKPHLLSIDNFEYKEERTIFFAILGMILLIPNVISAIRLYSIYGVGFDTSRLSYSILTQSGRYLYVLITCNLPTSLLNGVSILACIELMKGKKKLIYVTFFYVLLISIAFGGRGYFLNLIIYYYVIYFYTKKKKGFPTRFNYRMVIILVVSLFFITISRGTSRNSVVSWGVTYFSGSYSFLQYILDNPSEYGLTDGRMFGYMTFGIIIEPIILLLKIVVNADIDVPSYHFNRYAQPFINLSKVSYFPYNNNTTWLYTFLRDWGSLGIIIGPTIYALIINCMINRYEKTNSIRELMLIAYFYSGLVNSTMSYRFTSIASSLSILFILLISTDLKLKRK
jgi:oligosaccharide repeat unit polymerase